MLVVGHSNTVPPILSALGCGEPVTIEGDEYDNLFIVVPKESGKAALVRLRYSAAYQPIGLPLFCSSSHFWSGAK